MDFLANKNVIIIVTTIILAYVNPLCKVQQEEGVLYTNANARELIDSDKNIVGKPVTKINLKSKDEHVRRYLSSTPLTSGKSRAEHSKLISRCRT